MAVVGGIEAEACAPAAAPPPCDARRAPHARTPGDRSGAGDLSRPPREGVWDFSFFLFLWGIFGGEMKRRRRDVFTSLVSGMDRWERVELRQRLLLTCW